MTGDATGYLTAGLIPGGTEAIAMTERLSTMCGVVSGKILLFYCIYITSYMILFFIQSIRVRCALDLSGALSTQTRNGKTFVQPFFPLPILSSRCWLEPLGWTARITTVVKR